jgi:cell division protein FtsB
MATLDWHHTRTGGVTLVELLVTTEHAASIRIESELTPVWPPRRQGVPAAGWEGNSFETTVAADDRLVVGYASPAEPEGQPATVESQPTDSTASESEVDPQTLLRALGEAKPPRDLVPDGQREASQVDGSAASTTDEQLSAATPEQIAGDESIRALESWFSAVEKRLRTAERLASIDSADQLTAELDAVGGIDGVRQLQAQLAADREQLARLSDRQRQLSDRLETVDIPTGVLERVA